MKRAPFTPAQDNALAQIISLMRANDIAPGDVKNAYAIAPPGKTEKSLLRGEMILRLFAYMGGTLIFAGLGVFINMQWDHMGPFQRVLITLGSGFTAYVMGLVFAGDVRFQKAALPTFLLAFILQPIGLFVWLKEYFDGNDAALGSMIVFGPLALQQFLTFLKHRMPALIVFTLLYVIGFAGAFTEYHDINRGLASLMFGTFLFFVTAQMHEKPEHNEFSWFFYIVAVLTFFAGLYYFVGRTVFDPVALSFSLALLLYGVLRHSKTLYALGGILTFCYFCGGPGGGWAMWGMHKEIAAIFTGASLFLAGLWLRNVSLLSLFPVWIFFGAGFAFAGAYEFLKETMFEPLFFAIPAAGIYAALALRTRALLAVSILCLIGFITDFTGRHFADTVGWPILLMMMGVLTLASGFGFARLSKRIKTAVP